MKVEKGSVVTFDSDGHVLGEPYQLQSLTNYKRQISGKVSPVLWRSKLWRSKKKRWSVNK